MGSIDFPPILFGLSEACLDEMFPSWCQTECSIECGNAIEFNQRGSRLLRNDPQGFFRKITLFGLDFFEKRDKPCLVSVMVIVYNFFYLLGIHQTPSLKFLPIDIHRNAKLPPRVSDRYR
jgi:hypothetical protein